MLSCLVGVEELWGARRRSESGRIMMDRRRGNRTDVKVVDLEFDRAVFVIPFADGAHVVRVAVGRGDGFLDDGAVFATRLGSASQRCWYRRGFRTPGC